MSNSDSSTENKQSKSNSKRAVFRRATVVLVLVGTLGGLGSVFVFHRWIERNASGRVFNDISKIPHREVGLVLGTSKKLGDGRENLYFKFRTKAAAELYHEGKVSHLLVSGDNGTRGYDEPSDMRDRLVELGVPHSSITCDYAGFRTLDSIVRAREIFGLDTLTLISDDFHVRRALFLADKKKFKDVIAFASKEVKGASKTRMYLRELLARTRAVADIYILRTKPKFLGKKEPIEVAEP